jgi:hypothetical protein
MTENSSDHLNPKGREQAPSDSRQVSGSLYNRIIQENKSDFLTVGEKLGFYPAKDKAQQTNSEANKMLEPLTLTGDNKLAQKTYDGKAGKPLDKEAVAAADAKELSEVKNAFKAIDTKAYVSNDAALAAIANKLADNHELSKAVTDQKGFISSTSIDAAIRADLGQSVISAQHRGGSPKTAEFTDSQRESLDFVRTHIGGAAAAAGAASGEIANGAAQVSAGISSINEKMLNGMSSKDIANGLENFGARAQSASEKVWDYAKRQISKNLSSADEKSNDKVGGNKDSNAPSDNPAQDQNKLETSPPAEKAPEVRENTPQIADGEFGSVAKRVIEKIDTEHKGYVTKEQLAKALEDPQFKGKEAQALAAMYQNFDNMHNLSRHEGSLDSKSINAADLDKFDQIQKAQNQKVSEAYQMKNWAENNLAKYDNNGNTPLTRDQIQKFINDPKTPEGDKRMLQMIDKHFSEMGHFWESGVSKDAIKNYSDSVWKDSGDAKLVNGVWASTWNVQKGQTPEISHELYDDRNNPLNSINPEAIRQGAIGDCYFESSLAAVAKSNPELIKNAIKDNGDGTYTVTFPGAKDEPITVKAPTQAEQGLYNHGSPNGLWASVMEKAYGEYCQQHFWRRGPFNIGGGNTPTEGADGGGRTAGTMKLLTGSDVSTNWTTFTSQASVAANLEKAFSGNPPKAVTAGINNSFFGNQTADNFYVGHAYSITGFTPDGKGGGMVTIRNPWGGQNGTTDGTITIPLDKFMKNFSDISFQQ